MPKFPLLGSFGATAKEHASKKPTVAPKKLTSAYLIKTAACILAFLGTMAAFSYLCRELTNNYLLLVVPQTNLAVSYLTRLAISVVCLTATIGLMAVLVRPVWIVIITDFLAAAMYLFIVGFDQVLLIAAAVFLVGLLVRLIFLTKQFKNQINFSAHPLSDKNMLLFSLLAILISAAFWLGASKDMANRAYVIAPEIKSIIMDYSVAQTKTATQQQRLTPARKKIALAASRQKIQGMIDMIEKPIQPFAQYIPLALSVILFFVLQTIFLLAGLIALIIMQILFPILRLTHFTNFITETRETKHLTLEN